MKKSGVMTGFLVLLLVSAFGQQKYTPSVENMKSREWFQDAKFGLFIHWGVYSVLGDGEWVMNNQQIPIKTYEKLPAFFNPSGIQCSSMGANGERCGHEIHHHHEQAPRWLRHV